MSVTVRFTDGYGTPCGPLVFDTTQEAEKEKERLFQHGYFNIRSETDCPHDNPRIIPIPGSDETYTVCLDCQYEI